MAQNNKVLTVSYGAFSCTLEGFDDSVETLKAVTEYFRALSASDPGFGAEPVFADPSNLARIAQRNEQGTVDIRAREGGNILLRAEDADYEHDPIQPANGDPNEDTDSDQADLITAENPAPVSTDNDSPSLAEFMMQQAEPEAAHDTTSNETVADVAGDSMAAKLQRIRAVVSRNESGDESQTEDDVDVDEIFANAAKDDLTAKFSNEAAQAEPEESYRNGDDELLKTLDGLDTQNAPEPDKDWEPSTTELPNNERLADSEAAVESQEEPNVTAPLETPTASAGPNEVASDAGEDALMQHVLSAVDVPEEEILSLGEAAPSVPEPSSEVEPDTDTATDFTEIYVLKPEEMISDGRATQSGQALVDRPQLLKVKQADLELAKERAEQNNTNTPSPGHEAKQGRLQDQESDLVRLMATADERMGETESSTSRETYGHLRAAVAAAETEKKISGPVETELSDDRYRDDLANVTPAPSRKSKRTVRPTEDTQQGPLQLVPDQRVDVDNGERRPIRPRRVQSAAMNEEIGGDPGGTTFKEYATEKNATELSDLLETAAAYITFVEGHERFSRSQLMKKLRQIDGFDASREECLLGFNTLLHDAKIQKTGPGQFAASGDIGFQPDERAAG